MDGVVPAKRDSIAMGAIVAALESMPQRLAWNRIVVVTPAYRASTRVACQVNCKGSVSFQSRDARQDATPVDPPSANNRTASTP